MEQILLRVIISITIFLALYLTWKYFSYNLNTKSRRNLSNFNTLEIYSGLPTILYFWSPDCKQCNLQEHYINESISKLENSVGKVNFRKINALLESEFAEKFNIITVPTTIVLSSTGQITSRNHGLVNSVKIIEQF